LRNLLWSTNPISRLSLTNWLWEQKKPLPLKHKLNRPFLFAIKIIAYQDGWKNLFTFVRKKVIQSAQNTARKNFKIIEKKC
jgi:hypothetical protein